MESKDFKIISGIWFLSYGISQFFDNILSALLCIVSGVFFYEKMKNNLNYKGGVYG